jgi:hypothetical protein
LFQSLKGNGLVNEINYLNGAKLRLTVDGISKAEADEGINFHYLNERDEIHKTATLKYTEVTEFKEALVQIITCAYEATSLSPTSGWTELSYQINSEIEIGLIQFRVFHQVYVKIGNRHSIVFYTDQFVKLLNDLEFLSYINTVDTFLTVS